MASILKNQIIKHLSKFVKNLSPDKINLSTLRGEGDLTNLELDEKILTDLLELPNWLTLNRAWCNRVSIRIPWTKLKSVPIVLNLDEVHVSMGTCSELREQTTSKSLSSYAMSGSKYGFSEKIIDGVTVKVNALIINFKNPAFEASLQFSRILLESSSPTWSPSDLRFTRLKDVETGFILLFKELQWQTLRLEARSTSDLSLPPLRLITNLSRCRLTIKKRLSDCGVVGCRLVLIMDELLWVLTDAQLSAAMTFLHSLSHLIEQDTLANQRTKAARKLETLPEYHAQQQQQQQQHRGGLSNVKTKTPISRVFARYDVLETSYHFFSEKIDFHFCDDAGQGRSKHPDLTDGGSLQTTLTQLQIDLYPYHWVGAEGSNRKHWIRYEEGPLSRWVHQALESFTKQLLNIDSPAHSKLTRKPAAAGATTTVPDGNSPSQNKTSSSSLLHGSVLSQLRQLMASCLVLRLGDMLIYRVSTAKSRQIPKEFITGDREKFALPESMPILHMELTQFYFPGDTEFPIPQPKCFVQLNPLQVNFDNLTLLWLHSFARNFEKTLTSFSKTAAVPGPSETPLEVRLEALMPRVIMEVPGWDQPRSLQLQVSRLVCSNYRSTDSGSRADLAGCLERIQGQDGTASGSAYSGLCFSSIFPTKEGDMSPISETLLRHATYPSAPSVAGGWKRDLLWSKDKSEVWFIHLDPFWADFFTTSSQTSRAKPMPFIGTVPVTAWIDPDKEKLCGLLQVNSLISMQLDRAEYIFLLRLMENVKETAAFLDHQERYFNPAATTQSIVVGAILPQLDISIIFPPFAASVLQSMDLGESPLGDTESIYPDTSSITDLAHLSRAVRSMKFRNSHSEYVLSQQNTEQTESSSSSMISPVPDSTIVKSQSDSLLGMSESYNAPDEDVKANGSSGTGRFVTFAPEKQQQPIQSGFSSMKRGIHSFMSTMDAALKHSSQAANEDASDTLSVRSDASSDCEDNFVLLQGEAEQMDSMSLFRTKAKAPMSVEAAEEVLEVAVEVREDGNTNSDRSSPAPTASFMSMRSRDTAVVTFHINDLELVQQAVGSTSSMRLQAGHLSCDECTAISRDEFQAKFSSRSRGWREVSVGDNTGDRKSVTVPPLRLRMEQHMNFNPEKMDSNLTLKQLVAASTEAWVEASLTRLSLSMLLSSVTGLTAFVEDELIAPMIPLFVSLRNVEATLIEDRQPVRVGGPPSAVAPPLIIRLKHVLVQRDQAGVLSVGVSESRSSSESCHDVTSREASLQLKLEQLERENEELRKRLSNSKLI